MWLAMFALGLLSFAVLYGLLALIALSDGGGS